MPPGVGGQGLGRGGGPRPFGLITCAAVRSNKLLIVLSIAVAGGVALAGCTSSESKAPPDSLAAALVADEASGGLALRRGGTDLVRLAPSAFELGYVPALDDSLTYDPFYLDGFEIRWAAGRSLAPSDEEGGYRLEFEGGGTGTLTLKPVGDGRWSGRFMPDQAEGGTQGDVAFLRVRAGVGGEEGFYGLGSALDSPEHRGRSRAMQLEALFGEVDSGYNEAHVPVPFIVGTRGWGLFVEDPHLAVFDVATERADEVVATFGTGTDSAEGLMLHLYAAEHPLDVTRLYYETTGYPLLPARWALGPWIWRDENDDEAQVRADLATIRELDLATSGYWIDRPYASGVNTFDFSPTMFDDPQGMIDTAHDLGFRMALWHTPYADAEQAPELYAQAQENGWFPDSAGFGDLSRWGLPLDFTNPDAMAWWQGLIRRYTDMGIEGFKLDYAEDIIPGFGQNRIRWGFHDGSDELTQQSQYQRLYHQAYAETLPDSGGFLLCRAGTYGGQRYASVIWPGDLDANMARHREIVTDRHTGESFPATGGLPASIALALSLGVSGYPMYGSDTGGYRHAPPDKETFVRWFEQTALSTVMQVGTNSNDVPWEFRDNNGFDQESLDLYRRFARRHLRLWPYLWSYAKRLATDGRPIMRALGLAHPELGVHPAFEYLLGDHLYVAPVVEHGARTRTLHLPPGGWVHWETGERFEGPGEITVAAALGSLPLFQREGSVIPLLRPTIDTLAPTTAAADQVDSYATHGPGRLYARVVPSPSGDPVSFELFDGAVITANGTEDSAGGVAVELTPGAEFVAGVEREPSPR